MPSKVVIVDYLTGNLSAVKRSIDRVGGRSTITAEISDIERCDKIVLAGIGHFDTAMKAIRSLGLQSVLERVVKEDKKPVLGICLGMELMAARSEEGSIDGLGWIDASVVRLKIRDTRRFKVPHIGWNSAKKKKESLLMQGIPDSAEFYFNHSYCLSIANSVDELTETTYETPFLSAFEKSNIFGVQFHPEKSHDVGLHLLENFLAI